MADGFVNLQTELRAAKNDCAGSLGTLSGGMQRDGFFGDAWRVADQVERLNQLVALQGVLASKTIWVRPLLDLVITERSGDDSRTRLHFYLMNHRTGAGNEKLIDFA